MQFSKEMLKGTAEVIVMRTLKDLEEAYGYQLIKAIAMGSNDIFEFQEGTLYPILYRLELKGYVSSETKKAPSGKERRYYQLTKAGGNFLDSRTKEVTTFLKGLRQIFQLSASQV